MGMTGFLNKASNLQQTRNQPVYLSRTCGLADWTMSSQGGEKCFHIAHTSSHFDLN